ncbi:carboxy-S-adenosyl-L-methionine synthase CmoA [Marinicella gelatinilytica]|uniref:carboxy-S-adenosyl-L-methionine synthase CmoA n=1 Tax=Marinicella gelatinilytica TaxID=2996017 RepID=UPI002260C3E9|nr:carboxy-S-adenosyl-L-methionine synthase CmoA [Marinicella gelatinilytica]MCX7546282.1 carboxy-S-adenosyl-L-methionine synthase CmoA [Marinicella gelatinilytica]
MSNRDQLFSEAYEEVSAFAFDEQVASVFPDMIKRSVPGYDTILKGIAMYAMRFVRPNTRVYDLGSSLGAVSLTVDQAIGNQKVNIHAIDNSDAMVCHFKQLLEKQITQNSIHTQLEDLRQATIQQASMVVSNFTLQFLPPGSRRAVCERIYQGLNDQGIFILSEKVKSSQQMIDFYHGYKKINGYSDIEIAQKRQALEDTLKPDTLSNWELRLTEVGFHSIEVWFRAFNFVSLVAFK